MLQKLKTNSNVQKILLSLLIGIIMNLIWIVIIFIIDSSKTTSNELFSTSLLGRTPFAYLYYWSDLFLPSNLPDFKSTEFLALVSNTILYFTLSYILLSLFGGGKINSKKILSLFIGVLMNPILIVILFNVDWHMTTKAILSITQLNRTPFAYMFNWSSMVLPFQIDLKAEMLLALICNTILYFTLSYGLLSLLSRVTNRANKLR